MEPREMIRMIEEFYGAYPRPMVRAAVYTRLAALTNEQRADLWDVLIEQFEATQVRPVPDPPAIKRAMEDLPVRHRTPELPSPDDTPSATELRDGASLLRRTVDALAKRRRA